GGPARQVTQGTGAESMESADGKRVYFFRPGHQDGLWTVPVEGGLEEVVPELSSVKPTRAWTVHRDGIYFYQDLAAGKRLVQFFSFATRNVTTVLVPERVPLRTSPGLDVSADGRRLLYTQVDQKVEGLMMVEN